MNSEFSLFSAIRFCWTVNSVYSVQFILLNSEFSLFSAIRFCWTVNSVYSVQFDSVRWIQFIQCNSVQLDSVVSLFSAILLNSLFSAIRFCWTVNSAIYSVILLNSEFRFWIQLNSVNSVYSVQLDSVEQWIQFIQCN